MTVTVGATVQPHRSTAGAPRCLREFTRSPGPAAPPGPAGATTRFYGFPCAGGSAGYFRTWQRLLGPGFSVAAVQYPGRQDRCHEHWTGAAGIHRIARAAAAEIVARSRASARLGPDPDDTRDPVVLFGHSMGASIAHEVALLLRSVGHRVDLLAVDGRRAPHRLTARAVRPWTDAELVADIRRLGGAGGAALQDPDLAALVLPAVRGDYRALDRYHPTLETQLDVPIAAFVGDRDPGVSVEEMRRWADVTSRGCAVSVHQGGHFHLDRPEPVVARLSDLIRRLT